MDVSPAFPPESKTPEAVQPRKASFDHPPVSAQPRATPGPASRDRGHNATVSDLVPVDVVVVASISKERARLTSWTAHPASDWWDRIE